MSKFRQGGKLRLALLLAFSMLIQIVVPSLLSVTYAMEDEEAVGMEVTVGQAVEEVSEETREELEVEIESDLDTVEPAEEEIISDESDEEKIVTEEIEPPEEEIISDESDEEKIVTDEEVEKEPVAKVVQVEARNSDSGFSSLGSTYNESTGEFEIRFQYDLEKVQPGAEFTVDIDPDYVDLQELQDTVNYTIQRSGNSYKIKFNDEFSGSDQGILSIKTKVKEVDKSGKYEIKWKLDDVEESEIIFIKNLGILRVILKGKKAVRMFKVIYGI